ncbi:hypothetical protein CH330_08230 [candidate division WOR-3 bacterium JGI_Cruoil_03_51_56]|uniref:acylphosphatase n=1 Tax=candidate division WOR-3 bacterium JGI_Cruoil_03_51_56 TaxID=1973747 RepID=A0A235BQS9_UNCW3|nr:MAG: hypothetical protein CH330_08230 [candidate division WOR-3 bacterium JGI_Cruoil_03_51_56]
MEKKGSLSRIHAFVSGRVQGVFYRMFVVREATSRGLCGVVRNLDDGRVEVVAEGDREKLKNLVEKLRAGPRSALVREVTEEWEPYQHEFDDFHIDYWSAQLNR